MPRRNNRPKRPARRKAVVEREDTPNLDEVARRLVREGRASQTIIGPIPPRFLASTLGGEPDE